MKVSHQLRHHDCGALTGRHILHESHRGNQVPSDISNGWEVVAKSFMDIRSDIGTKTVRDWASALPKGANILDIGCGNGLPLTAALAQDGFHVSGIDASPTLAKAFQTNFPEFDVACEAAENSHFFGRKFDGALAVGLIFLLPKAGQIKLIRRVADTLHSGGSFLFSAPAQECTWNDSLTGRSSLSLGMYEYRSQLAATGLALSGSLTDEGGNHYYCAQKA